MEMSSKIITQQYLKIYISVYIHNIEARTHLLESIVWKKNSKGYTCLKKRKANSHELIMNRGN